MVLFTDKNIKKFIIRIGCLLLLLTCISQILLFVLFGEFKIIFFIFTILFSICVLWVCLSYFIKQQQQITDAEDKINDFISGNTDARIDCNEDGSIFKFFHAVNTLATSLNAHTTNEMKSKEFLKNMILDISHQLKTPLSALYIYNELLQDESTDHATVTSFAKKSEKELDRINTLVQNLLKITKLDAGAITLTLKEENLEHLLTNTIHSFEAQAMLEHKSITLSGSSSTSLYCDRDWMVEAISNIIKNALEHTGENGQIRIHWHKMATLTRIVIEDNGSGISPEDIHHIFKRFYRSKSPTQRPGIGLGLSLVKSIIESHKGTITVSSHINMGTTFTLDLTHLTKL